MWRRWRPFWMCEDMEDRLGYSRHTLVQKTVRALRSSSLKVLLETYIISEGNVVELQFHTRKLACRCCSLHTIDKALSMPCVVQVRHFICWSTNCERQVYIPRESYTISHNVFCTYCMCKLLSRRLYIYRDSSLPCNRQSSDLGRLDVLDRNMFCQVI
jgi:hypothetical protein